MESNLMRELTPEELTNEQLTAFLRRRGNIVSKKFEEKLEAVKIILKGENRSTVLVPMEDKPKSIFDGLSEIISSTFATRNNREEEINYDIPPVTEQPGNRDRFRFDHDYGDNSPIEPRLNVAHVQRTPSYSVDSFEAESEPGVNVNSPPEVHRHVHYQEPISQNMSRYANTHDMRSANIKPAKPILPTPPPPPPPQLQWSNSTQNQSFTNRRPPNIKFRYTFRLGEGDISDFLSAVRRHSDLVGMTDGEAVLLALSNFKDVAESNLIEDGLEHHERNNFSLFREKLIQQFGMTPNEWLAKFETVKRSEKESTAQLLNRMTILFRNGIEKKMLSADNYATIVRKFKIVINPILKSHLEANNYSNYRTIAAESAKLERAYNIPRSTVATFKVVNMIENETVKAKVDSRPCDFDKKETQKKHFHCEICNTDSHGTQYCFMNVNGPRFKGMRYLEAFMKKTSTSKNY